MKPEWDAIVIGSGVGGLSAAGFLAKVAKMKVLVLEKRSERGGLTQVFRRDGASWDVGVHYIGDLQSGSIIRTLFDFLSDGRLEWNRMPDDFERFLYPDLDFDVPSDPAAFEKRLIERSRRGASDPPLLPRPALGRQLARAGHPAAVHAGAARLPHRPI